MSNIVPMDLVNAEIIYKTANATNKQITQNILDEWRHSVPIEDMIDAESYYKVENKSIEAKTRAYEDDDGKLVLNTKLANTRSKTGQYRNSVLQKVNYALAKPFIISCDNDDYRKKWEEFLNDKIRKSIIKVGKNGINKGIGWAFPCIDEKGELTLINVKPETIYPAWTDEDHTKLDAAVRDYQIIEYTINGYPQTIYKVEYWDKEIFEKYIDYGKGEGSGALLQVDTTDLPNEVDLSDEELARTTIQQAHLKNKDGQGAGWGRVPFIFFKGNEDEMPLLNECRTDIDSYDYLKSKSIDSLLDDIDATIVIKNISPEMGELSEARQKIKNSRIIAVDETGGADVLKVNTDISEVVQQLDLIKKDVQDNTNTVNVTTVQLGTNPSGQALKSFYEPLNTWCNGFESEFRVFMENLKYFFDMYLSWKNEGSFEELQQIPITFTLDRDMMMNESELLEGVVKMNGILSQETLDEMNPWVEDPAKEAERREEDLKKQQEQQELYQFEKDTEENEENTGENEKSNENNQNKEKTTSENKE